MPSPIEKGMLALMQAGQRLSPPTASSGSEGRTETSSDCPSSEASWLSVGIAVSASLAKSWFTAVWLRTSAIGKLDELLDTSLSSCPLVTSRVW